MGQRRYKLFVASTGIVAMLLLYQNCAPPMDSLPSDSAQDSNQLSGALPPPATPIAPPGSEPPPNQQPPPVYTSPDPGIGTGLWIPPGTVNFIVADHSGSPAHPIVSYVPGCLNGLGASSSMTGCAANSSFSGRPSNLNQQVTVRMTTGTTVSLRYAPKANAGTSVKWVNLSGADGSSNLDRTFLFWISTVPGQAYESTDAKCRFMGSSNLYLTTGPGYCPLNPAIATYYISFKAVDSSCEVCRYKLVTNNADFQ